MHYPNARSLETLLQQITAFSRLKHEQGAAHIVRTLAKAELALGACLAQLKQLPPDATKARREPDDLRSIRLLRPMGPRRLWVKFDDAKYRRSIAGALLGRFAGCTLGVPVEGQSILSMQNLARECGGNLPPAGYWRRVYDPSHLQYGISRRENFTRAGMNGVPVDDDIAYTLLGLLTVERYGPEFTTAQIGKSWLRYLPTACTAEKAALENLKAGVGAMQAAEKNNPYCEWIGAEIRADPWGYMAPGWPELAAGMAYRDACLSHRRNGIYGAMYFAAAIAAAFAVKDPVEALEIGLSEIPRNCALARAVRWALHVAPRIRNYRQAREAVDRRFRDMHAVHTINNACLTIWGITIGRTDFSRVIGETVAMGLDNDCTAATAGSIVGAVVGKEGIPSRWHRPFRNKVHSYLIGKPSFKITGLQMRFALQAAKVYAAAQ
ncbi:MAG: ADP-ribosylglycohydrolase family protein [Kiritimatiellia bacterium]